MTTTFDPTQAWLQSLVEQERSDDEGCSREPELAPCMCCGEPECEGACLDERDAREDVEPDSNRTLGLREDD